MSDCVVQWIGLVLCCTRRGFYQRARQDIVRCLHTCGADLLRMRRREMGV